MANPLISVMIPTYNRARYIQEAIDSILAQDYRPLEVVVVDDGSTDNTAEIIRQYDPAIIRYHYRKKCGQPAARNVCCEKASGAFLAWLDSDDYYLPGKLTAQMQYLQEHPGCEIVFTLLESFYDSEIDKENMNQAVCEVISTEKMRQCHATMLARKGMIRRVGPRNEAIAVSDDLEWLYRCSFVHGVDLTHCLEKPYLMRRLHLNCHSYKNTNVQNTSHLMKMTSGHLRQKLQKARGQNE